MAEIEQLAWSVADAAAVLKEAATALLRAAEEGDQEVASVWGQAVNAAAAADRLAHAIAWRAEQQAARGHA